MRQLHIAPAQAIRKFLDDNPNLHLHPGRTPEEWGQLVLEKGGCPCVPGRDKCPCDEALEDIKQLNHCRCYLFCNEDYLKLYDEVVVQRRKKQEKPMRCPNCGGPLDEEGCCPKCQTCPIKAPRAARPGDSQGVRTKAPGAARSGDSQGARAKAP